MILQARISGGGNHRGVVGGKRVAWEIHVQSSIASALLECRTQLAVRRNSSGDEHGRHSQIFRGFHRPFDQITHYRILEFAKQTQSFRSAERQQLIEFSFASRDSRFSRLNFRQIVRIFANMIEHGSFQSAETEIQRVASHFRRSEFYGSRNVAGGTREAIENRSSGISKAKQFRNFVVSFARCVIASLPNFAVRPQRSGISARRVFRLYLVQNRVTAGNNQTHRRQCGRNSGLVRFQKCRMNVAFKMIDWH